MSKLKYVIAMSLFVAGDAAAEYPEAFEKKIRNETASETREGLSSYACAAAQSAALETANAQNKAALGILCPNGFTTEAEGATGARSSTGTVGSCTVTISVQYSYECKAGAESAAPAPASSSNAETTHGGRPMTFDEMRRGIAKTLGWPTCEPKIVRPTDVEKLRARGYSIPEHSIDQPTAVLFIGGRVAEFGDEIEDGKTSAAQEKKAYAATLKACWEAEKRHDCFCPAWKTGR